MLGLGPWYYDNGSVEITRADERHDRVDVVSRGFLGLTVACARCHDHKYDPIPQQDYYALAGVFLNSQYHEYPLAPKSVVDEYKALEKKIKDKQKLLDEFMTTESRQLAETLALQSAKYMQAAWKVTGEPKDDAATVAAREKLDYELFDRWVKFLAKPPKFYPYLKKWQAMVKDGGTEDEAKTLADEFQALLLDVMFEAREIKEENDIIRAKALPGTKKKEPANLPNEFVTNDDFCPGCGLELKSLPAERGFLWTTSSSDDLRQRRRRERQGRVEARPARVPRLGARALAGRRSPPVYREPAHDIEAMKKRCRAKYPYVHGVKDVEKPVEQKLAIRGNPMRAGEVVPRRFLPVLSRRRAGAAHEGQRPPRSRRSDPAAADRHARHRQPRLEVALRHRHRRTRRATSASSASAPTNPELLEYLAQSFIDNGYSIKKLHRADHAEPGLPARAPTIRRRTSRRTPAIASTGAPTAGA